MLIGYARVSTQEQTITRIPHLDPADLPEDRGNAGETAESYFHPSRPSGFGYLVHPKNLAQQLKSGHGSGRTPVHLGNPGINLQRDALEKAGCTKIFTDIASGAKQE